MASESIATSSAPADSRPEANPLTWYGRLGVWFGVVMLLVQSVTGRGVGLATVVAVAALVVGFVAFLIGLAVSGYRRGRQATASSVAVEANHEQRIAAPEPAGGPQLEAVQPEEQTSTQHANGAVPQIEERKVRALQVLPGMPHVGQMCPRCRGAVQVGQMVATCFVCQGVHHAGCWVENGFSCATPDCPGKGDLEAPRSARAPGELGV